MSAKVTDVGASSKIDIESGRVCGVTECHCADDGDPVGGDIMQQPVPRELAAEPEDFWDCFDKRQTMTKITELCIVRVDREALDSGRR